MSKVRMFGVAVAAAGVLLAGSGLASAASIPLEPATQSATPIIGVGEPDPTGGTGSSKGIGEAIKALVKALNSGSGKPSAN
ncbi:hypothetical protein [Nocardia arthritidis]|uniref:Uncharacterized protein n=1 Tax=Nocardia arthritidis TaxID=228602 RepID=A0A6G9YTU3_9NOCA|nr:hypothetical protein [Nocardia arthritidis]QIS16560.1 hypothetical protein F5544_43785 [Nocardia arthritidis]